MAVRATPAKAFAVHRSHPLVGSAGVERHEASLVGSRLCEMREGDVENIQWMRNWQDLLELAIDPILIEPVGALKIYTSLTRISVDTHLVLVGHCKHFLQRHVER
jgi:hypothetical protein